MKKRILVLLTMLAMILSLCACSSSDSDTSDSDTEETTTTEETTSEDEMSQSEWVEQNAPETEDGYEVVDEINIDTDQVALKYTGYEIIDATQLDDNDNEYDIKELIVYFDYTNKTSITEQVHNAFELEAIQSGTQLTYWMDDVDGNESVENSYKNICDGKTLNVGILFELEDEENEVKIRTDCSYSDIYSDADNLDGLMQQMTIDITE